MKKLLPALLILMLAAASHAQIELYNHPELKWLSFETEHFVVYYTDGLEDVALLGAKAAEHVHGPLVELYEYTPDTKVALIFSDTDDIANAASYFQSNKIKFYATSMSWDFRGTHNWIYNVVTHEYAHMIQLGATRKWKRNLPAAYFQYLSYEEERRPDVLYGYPNVLVSWPLPSVTVPAWFAEGTAQFQFTGHDHDFWDSHRDMLLRQATLSGRLLSFNSMGYFGKSSLESEGVYNQGFSLTRYIADKTGDPGALQRASKQLSSPYPITLDKALEKATGKRGQVWYDEWKVDLERQYGALRDRLAPTLTDADTIPTEGFVNLYPRISPDGKKIAFVSNQNRDYFGQSSLYLFDIEKNEAELIAPAAQGGLSWLPDGSAIIFARQGVRSPSGSLQYDLYAYKLESKKTVQLSRGLRAEGADVSPDGQWLAMTINEQGRREIAVASMPDLSHKKVERITPDDLLFRQPSLPHEQYYLPRWSPDGTRLAVAQHLMEGRSIRIFDVAADRKSLSLASEISGENVELRDPSWTEDGRGLLVAWDVSGISNIYRHDIESGQRDQLTSVLGGAFYPMMHGDLLVYSEFCADGFRVCYLRNPQTIRPTRNPLDEENSYVASVPKPEFSLAVEPRESKPYKPAFEKLYWFPRVAFDYGTFKPGTYILINDVLEKLSFIGGFALNQKKDYDLFGQVEYRGFYPTFFVEYYNIQRRLSSLFADSTRIIGEEDFQPIYDQFRIRYRYSLHEIDGGVRVPVGKDRYFRGTVVYDRYIAHNRFDDGTSIGITYFRGWAGKFGYFTDQRRRSIDSEINPSGGYKGFLELTRANHQFFTDLKIGGDVIGLQEVYAPYNYWMAEGGLERYFSLPGWDHTLELRGKGGYIAEPVDPFFYMYAGGLPGMRGYSYYSLGGERTAVATATYRFPIIRDADWNLWPLALNRIYGSVFTDVGNAWRGDFEAGDLKKDVGAGLRFQLHSFYAYPTAIAFDVAYGMDRFAVVEDDVRTEYGDEWRYYFTVLFDFYSPFSRGGYRNGF